MLNGKDKDIWEKLPAVSGLIASILIPVVLAVMTNSYTSTMKESENRLKYIEVAVGILSSEPTPEARSLRAWAVDVMNKNSNVPIDAKARQELIDRKLQVTYPTYSTGTTNLDSAYPKYDSGIVTPPTPAHK